MQTELINTAVTDDDRSAAEDAAILADEYLAFVSDDLNYAVSAVYITEIINNHHITHLPKAPDFIKGIINLRGQIIPIVDIRLRMNRPAAASENDEMCIVVIDVNSVAMGLMVDKVSHVVNIKAADILEPPAGNRQELINGITKIGDTVYLVLDCESLVHNC